MQLKRSLREAEDGGDIRRIEKINRELSHFAAAAQELRQRGANLFDALTDKIGADDDDIITQMNTEYENANPEVKKNIRKLVEYCLRGLLEEHLQHIIATYARKSRAMQEALERHLANGSVSGTSRRVDSSAGSSSQTYRANRSSIAQ